MKQTFRGILSIILCIGLLMPLTGCFGREAKNDSRGGRRFYEDSDEDEIIEFSVDDSFWGTGDEDESGQDSDDTESREGDSTPHVTDTMPNQLSIEDIQAMNPGATVIDIWNNDGYLSTLVGKYYDLTVRSAEEAVESIKGIASLLGLSKGCEFFAVYSDVDPEGYTYYTFQQRYGGYTLRYATMNVIVDPEGYTAGVTCSFVPNVGTASQEPAITAAEAESVVKEEYSSEKLTFYSDQTDRLAASFNNVVYNCYVVYTNNPVASAAFDMPYLEHFVTTDGVYKGSVPTNNLSATNTNGINNDIYFEGMNEETLTKNIKLQTGEVRTISVPVCKNPNDGKYYLMDTTRKIAVAEYYNFNFFDDVVFVTSDTLDGWSDNNLLAYDNYIKTYDFYASRGIRSVDGFETPILITVGFCDENRQPVNNACFYGVNLGWACFAVSDINNYSDCLDVVAHEYTHGVTRQSMQGTAYRNETGSINESYSDIMGNLCEMITGDTTDTEWLIAENSGTAMRDMGNPNVHEQPLFVGDQYYMPAVLNPNFDVNDYGGVHVNNSLVGHMAYTLNKAGMSLDEEFLMWVTSIDILTPMSDYEDLHGILLFSLKVNGMLEKYGGVLNQAFAEAGLNDDWTVSYREATKAGCGRILLETDADIAAATCMVLFADASGTVIDTGYPDANGWVSVLLPAGTYIVQFKVVSGSTVTAFNYIGTGWRTDGDFASVQVTNGGVTTLVSTSGDSSGSGSGSGSGSSGTSTTGSSGLNLITFDGGFFTLLMPEGWRIEVDGDYGDIYFNVFNPENTNMRFFDYAGMAPFHKNETTRDWWKVYDSTGIISSGPVLPSHDIAGVLSVWQYCIDYQIAVTGVQQFPTLADPVVKYMESYSGPYAGTGIETAALATCSGNDGGQNYVAILTALVDLDATNAYGGMWPYTACDTAGVVCPVETFDEYYQDLLLCLQSIQFSESYIQESRTSSFPLGDNASIAQGMAQLAAELEHVYLNGR